jgi:predicted kinase
MKKPLLIIISGPPCTGKTTLGKKIAEEFNLPFISKDDIKESLFDSLGWNDREWSKKIGIASYQILYYYLEMLLKSGRSFIVESNFKPEFDNPKLNSLSQKYDFRPLQIQCRTNGEILFERFKKRVESGERHPGHVDHLNYYEFKDVLLKGKHEKLDIGGKFMEIDTTDFGSIYFVKIFTEIRLQLEE